MVTAHDRPPVETYNKSSRLEIKKKQQQTNKHYVVDRKHNVILSRASPMSYQFAGCAPIRQQLKTPLQ